MLFSILVYFVAQIFRERVQISVGNPINSNGLDKFSDDWESVLICRHYLPFPIMIKTLLIQSEADTFQCKQWGMSFI